MALKTKEKTTRMNESLHYCKFETQKFEHTNQNKVRCKLFYFSFLHFYCFQDFGL
jgi:hypothetical protein